MRLNKIHIGDNLTSYSKSNTLSKKSDGQFNYEIKLKPSHIIETNAVGILIGIPGQIEKPRCFENLGRVFLPSSRKSSDH